MEHTFGHNCENFIPALGKCKVLTKMYSARSELLSTKILDAKGLLNYLDTSPESASELVSSGVVEALKLKNGAMKFRIIAPWKWDDCPEADTGGQCLYFVPHQGAHIRCIRDLQDWPHEHPNLRDPSEDELCHFTQRVQLECPVTPYSPRSRRR